MEPLLISCVFVEVSEVATREDKLTLDFAVTDIPVVLPDDVISADCEEIYDDKVMSGSVGLVVTAENLVFPVVAVNFNFEASVVSMSFASGTGNEVTTSLITAEVVLDVTCETAGVSKMVGKGGLSSAGSMPEIRHK